MNGELRSRDQARFVSVALAARGPPDWANATRSRDARLSGSRPPRRAVMPDARSHDRLSRRGRLRGTVARDAAGQNARRGCRYQSPAGDLVAGRGHHARARPPPSGPGRVRPRPRHGTVRGRGARRAAALEIVGELDLRACPGTSGGARPPRARRSAPAQTTRPSARSRTRSRARWRGAVEDDLDVQASDARHAVVNRRHRPRRAARRRRASPDHLIGPADLGGQRLPVTVRYRDELTERCRARARSTRCRWPF